MLLVAAPAAAQLAGVYSADFQNATIQAAVPGWVDSGVRGGPVEPLYKTWPDPLQPGNSVYGFRQMRRRAVAGEPPGGGFGTFSTYTAQVFTAHAFEYRGRLLRTNADARLGLTIFSSIPDEDRYYLIGLSAGAAMRLSAQHAGTVGGTIDSGFTPESNRWVRFAIQAEDTASATVIRARFWNDGTAEPTTFAIDAVDSSPGRLAAGRIGIWSAGGDVFVDDLSVRSSASRSSAITLIDAATGQHLDPSSLALFKSAARIEIQVEGQYAATLDGSDYTSGAPITGDGFHTLAVHAGDNEVTLRLLVDTTPPVISFRIDGAPFRDGQAFNHDVTLSAAISDVSTVSVTVLLNGAAAALPITISEEKVHHVSARAVDQVGWESVAAETFAIVKAPPELIVLAPRTGMCTAASEIQVSGRAIGAIASVKVTLGASTPVSATVAAADGSFSAAVPAPTEGRFDLTIEASDTSGHRAIARVPLIVDRTKPVVEITAAGSPFLGGSFNRVQSLFVRSIDADPAAAIDLKLNDRPYLTGTPITSEGAYVVRAVARDCAGNVSDEKAVRFTIDFVAPRITSLDPVDGASIESNAPSIRGAVDSDDLQSVVIDGIGLSAAISGRSFAFSGVTLSEGTNRLTLIAADHAGNAAREPYTLEVKSTLPAVSIVENGSPIPPDTIFNRMVTPVVRASEPHATIVAALNGAPFVSGTPIAADAAYTLTAAASDAFGHKSATATATFTIDRTPPSISIVVPAAGARLRADHVDVRVNAAGADSVRVSGVAALPSGSEFVATVPLDSGANLITATASDRAGNNAVDQIEVTRDDAPGIVLTVPGDNVLTNRPLISVAGQVLTPSPGMRVVLNGTEVPLDAAGSFRLNAFPLAEGLNTITATVIDAAAKSAVSQASPPSATARVTADFTPPKLRVLANGVEMGNGDRFVTAPSITLQASDERPGVTTTVTLDGVAGGDALLHLTDGGHTLRAIARDAAGNETRVDRTFVAGSGGSPACVLANFDPPDRSAIYAASVKFAGRAAGAGAVLVNGTRTEVAGGSFATGIPLTREGANAITISCADSSGAALADGQVTLTLFRVTGAPSITIDLPARNSVFATDTITVSGTVSSDAVSGDVNGVPFTPLDGRYSLTNIALSKGANTIIARAKNGAGRTGIGTAYVIRAGAPRIAITSPLPAAQTGATSIDVSGTYVNVDPATIAIAGATVAPHPTSDTAGTFVAASVPISGPTTITVTGRSAASEAVSASVDVQSIAGWPAISIDSPADNMNFPATRSDVLIAGTISSVAGSIVQVNGTQVPVDGASHFSATVTLTATGMTPVIARVATPDGATAADNLRLVHLGPLSVKDNFPADGGLDIDPGVLFLILFSNPIDAASARSAVTLTDSAGQQTSVTVFVDGDAVSVAPNIPLASGSKYTLSISPMLKDAAGSTLLGPFTLSIVTVGSAPAVAPIVDQSDTAGCFQAATITGTAAIVAARVRLDLDGVSTTVATGADRKFRFDVTFSGQPGYHIARVREVGADGTLSPESTVCYRINCAGPRVIGASLDRPSKRLVIQFSKPVVASTVVAGPGGTVQLAPAGGTALTGAVSFNAAGDVATITCESDLGTLPLTLTVDKQVKDSAGVPMVAAYTQIFAIDSIGRPAGKGYVSGAVYDATNGRPLPNASVSIGGSVASTDERGRFTKPLGEGAYSIEAVASGFTTVWRQVVVRAGAGTIPLDFRLTRRGDELTATGGPLTLAHGGDDAVTRQVRLSIPAAALSTGTRVALTAAGGQSLAAPLPLGWSPLAGAEVVVDGSVTPVPLNGSRLTFALSTGDVGSINAAAQTLSVARYESDRDEWRVVAAVAPVAGDGTVSADVLVSGCYALVYADRAPGLAQPPPAHTGATLQGVADPCKATPDVCRPSSRSFVLDPSSVPPSGRTVATLTADGTKPYPSGAAVQATIDEQLNLGDGSVLVDPPFTTDLLLYRTPAGDAGVARFHLAPSAQAAAVTLRDGVDHIVVVDDPGRVDRGALIGPEGGRIFGGDSVTVDIPTGATLDPIHATVTPLSDFGPFGTVDGFHIVGGFRMSLSFTDSSAPVSLLKSARATLTIDNSKFATANRQVIVAEVLGGTPFGTILHLAATTRRPATTASSTVAIFTTNEIDPLKLPLDGIVREGSYLLLAADAPIAVAFGQVRLGRGGAAIANVRVSTVPPMGVAGLTRAGGMFALPVPAKPGAPFALRPRAIATGDGAPAASPIAPDPDAVVPFGDLILVAQRPHLLSIMPADGAVLDPGAPFQAQATFDMTLDPAGAASAMIVNNSATGAPFAGTVDAAGSVLAFHPSDPLQPAAQYSMTILPSLLGANGAPFGRTVVSRFSTRNIPSANTSIHAGRIHVTIPDAGGMSTISGTPGALPAGSQAIAVRRSRSFVVQAQATVASDGSFSFIAGGGVDAITTGDAIDLHVIDAVSHATIAIIPLTPFTTPDGKGFLAPPDVDVHFVAPDGTTVDVPSGAFDVPTLITVTPSGASAFADVPSFSDALNYSASANVQFEGIAKKRVDIQIPIPANAGTSKPFYLGYLGQSVRGPRVMIVDTLRMDSGHFTTTLPSGASSSSLKPASTASLRPSSVFSSPAEVKAALLGIIAGGTYGAVTLASSTSWALFDGMAAGADLFWDSMPSLYASSLYLAEGHGRVLVPVAAGRPFEVVGVDAATGLESFRRVYDPLAEGDPTAAIALPSPIDNQLGPYPVFISPSRVEVVDLPASGVTLTSVRNLELTLDNGMLRVTSSALPPDSRVEVLNTSTGNLQVDDSFVAGHTFNIPASAGDRILLLVAEQNVDPNDPVSVVFNKPVHLDGDPDAFIHDNGLVKVFARDGRSNGPYSEITPQVRFEVDSGNRRVAIHFENPLQLGKRYRLVLSRNIGDAMGIGGMADLRLGQRRNHGTIGPLLSDDLHIDFTTREPGGQIASFDLSDGAVRDLALNGNIALVAALGGGLQAFDVSDPAALDARNHPHPLATVPAGATEFWAVASDHHGRVYTTGLTNAFGVLRTYRLSDFLSAPRGMVTRQIGAATLSWRPGININVPLGTETTLGDRPEATPRKLQIVLQDDELPFSAATLIAAFSGSATDLGGGFQSIGITVGGDRTIPYQTQRVTVENRTLDLRWPADVPRSGIATISGIIARAGDQLVVLRNRATYGVVSLFGYGISVVDLNAVESNDATPSEPSYRTIQEQVALSKGADSTPAPPCDPAQSGATGAPCPIRDLAFSPEALIRSTASSALKVFALDANRGVLDLNVVPPSLVTPAGGGLTLASAFIDHPRIHTLRDLYRNASGLKPFAHFTSIAAYGDYALIAGNQLGLLLIRLDGGALDWGALVDVVWIPAGAYAVRVMPESDMAVVIDGAGRVLLVDLKRIDESSQVGQLPACTSATCTAELFPTARKSLQSPTALPPDADWVEVGADDPRIIWKSRAHLVHGTLPPLVDPSTGFVFTGDVNTTRMNVIAAIDPKLRVVVNTGPAGLGETGGIVPLGIDPPPNIVSGPDGSLAAFRVEANLPAGMSLRLAVESEMVAGSKAAPAPPPLPPAHLRGSTAVVLSPSLPTAVLDQFPALRLQRGANRLISPWVIVLADPRAAKQYVWPSGANKRSVGCVSCDRPGFLQNDATALELLSGGRFILIHPEPSVFSGSYAYLNDAGRLTARLSSIPADTIRPTNVLSAAQDPPLARGALQSSVLLHSGEVVEQAIDLDAGGRAGWDVVFDRTYRSRTLGGTPLGLGWESSILRRLRVLPNENVEYRDSTGEVWLFRSTGSDYLSPAGLYLRLARSERGWTLVDQKQRITTFDSLGRLASESDVFYDGAGGGNIIRYLYDSSGRLGSIVDPVGRVSTISYDSDQHVKTIMDWRGRTIDNHFDPRGRLTSVDLPRTKNATYLEFDHSFDSTRPTVHYDYQPAAADYNASLELATNLRSIQEPGDTVARVTLGYFDGGNQRDMLKSEVWGTTEHADASFDYTVSSPLRAATEAVVTDVLRQQRTYSIGDLQPSDHFSDRAHTDRIVESAIPVWAAAPFGSLPAAILPTSSDTTTVDRTTNFGHGVDGRLETINRSAGGTAISLTTFGYTPAGNLGVVVQSRSVTPAVTGMAGIAQSFGHDGAFLTTTESEGERIDTPEPRRGALTPRQTDGGVTTQTTYSSDGLISEWHTLPPSAPATGAGERARSEYFPADDPAFYRRGRRRSFTSGDDLTTTLSYPDGDTAVRDAPRGVRTRIEYDELRRPTHITMSGPGSVSPEEWFAYDARGRLVRHKRRQGDKQPEERYEYDVVGRMTRSSLYDGATEVEATKFEYALPDRITRTILPAGGIITSTLDGLGRTIDRMTDPLHPFATITAEHIRYDADDNVVFSTNGRDATATRYDAAHRPVETLRSDLGRVSTKIDGWGRLTESKDLGTGALFRAGYTPGGKLQSTATNTSSQEYGWDAAGRTRSVVSRRGANEAIAQSQSDFDVAGRLVDQKMGTSNGSGITRLFSHSRYVYNGLDVASTVVSSENGDANSSSWNLEHDLLGQATRVQSATTPGFSSDRTFDESGNVTSSRTPSRPGTFAYKHDARGLTTDEILPNTPAPNRYAFDASGAIRQYLDPQSEETKATNDGLGRPVLRSYPDGSTEEIHYQGDQVIQIRDRQGRLLNFSYNLQGQLEQIRNDHAVLDELSYDIAGRLIGWKSEGTKIEYGDFDADNRPQTTRQIRYRPDGTELGHYVQRHTWNGAGQRTSWSMPASTSMGSAAWTHTVFEEHDAMGNVSAIRRTAAGASVVLMTADFRNAGRPATRRVTLGAGPAQLVREYGYDDSQTGIGRLAEVKVFSGGTLIAGSRIGFTGHLRTREQLLGVAGDERATSWTYDDRGRVLGMLAATESESAPAPGVPGSVNSRLTDADFQTDLTRTAMALPSVQFTPRAGHKIATIARGGQSESILYQKADGSDGGSQRTEDGRFRYEFDERGRLRKVTERLLGQARLNRVVYSYNAMDRMMGRRVETADIHNGQPPQESDWTLSTTPSSLPPSITFVWDPISDQLVAMFEAESGRPLRQFIHGGRGYDDPLEVYDGVHRYYPILDEAGTGSLQAVVDESGKLVNRTIMADPYGEDAEAIQGPAVDKITISGTKDSAGNVSEVKIAMHLTEPIDPSTIAGGARLTPATVTPALADPYTITWTLGPTDWAAVTTSLHLEVTNTLRSTTFGPAAPVLFAGFTEPLSDINQRFASTPNGSSFTTTPYNTPSLATLGTRNQTDVSAALVMSPFKAHPLTDPFTGLDYVRARWLDKRTGTFLSPDPAGYRDSSNLYAYCAGDPVGCSDPEGLAGYFFDGTWNDKDVMVNVTNVAKLFNAYRGRRYYLPGVGTSKMLPAVDKYTGGGTGAGGTGKLEEMYWNLAKAFAAGDRQIDIFGFSRGAALAVAFANMIEERGIPDLSSKRTVRIATHNGVRSIDVYDRYFKAPRINFVGVFDIVGSFGLPGNEENIGFDLSRPKNTVAIRHATAMDENRFFFPLTSMLDAPGRGPANVKEVGFRGVHSDIGGGYEDIDDLAHGPLNWMWSEAGAAGVPLNPLGARDRRVNPNASAHYSAGAGEEFLDIMYRKAGWRYHRKIYYQGQ